VIELLCQFLVTQLCEIFMITSWIVNRFEKHILRIWNIIRLFQWPLTQLAYCQSSKCLPLALSIYQLHSVEGRAKCPTPTVPKHRELVTGTRAAGQGSK